MNPEADPDFARVAAGPFQTNTYLVWSGDEAIIIDPGDDASVFLEKFQLNNRKVLAVVSTHGHMDHLFDVPVLKSSLECSFLMGNGDEDILKWSYSVSERYMGKPLKKVETDMFLSEGDNIRFGKVSANIISLPGHTPGSIGLVIGSVLFTVDTLFRFYIVRTNIGG